MRHFKDFSEDTVMDGEKVSIDSILDQDIEVHAFRIRNSRYTKGNNGNYTIIQFDRNGHRYIAFTGSTVLHDQLKKYEDKLPFIAQIKKIGTYYTLS